MNANVLCIPYTYTLSHISRPLLVAQELKNRDHCVVFGGESPRVTFIEKEGFCVLPLYEPNPATLFDNIRKKKLRFASDAEVNKMIEADLLLYKKVKPDLVLTDGRFSAPISTHIAGLRHAAIVNASSTEYRSCPYVPLFEWIPRWFVNRGAGLRNRLDSLNLRIEMFVFDNVMSIFKRLSKKHGLKKTVTATNCLTGKDLTLLADIPEYFPLGNSPDDYHYIGPITLKSKIPPPSWWPPKKDGKCLVYVTMGTTGIGDFFYKVYDLLMTSEMTAIVTTGGQIAGLETIGGKLYVENFINGDSVMEICDLVVCHGGNGTIYQALQHGKPVVGIPTIPDQSFNMRRVEALGVGRSISWKEFQSNPEVLMRVIDTVLSIPSFSEKARRMQGILKTYEAEKKAADIIERYIQSGRP